MMNGSDHTACAVMLWEARMQAKMLEMECIALRQELAKLQQAGKKAIKKAVT